MESLYDLHATVLVWDVLYAAYNPIEVRGGPRARRGVGARSVFAQSSGAASGFVPGGIEFSKIDRTAALGKMVPFEGDVWKG
jgi:hypothetical protein